ncbi:putative late blight resistance protein homolog R1A-10 [Salvia miltiorrhiza]|uniref:putative late blight resistance protein homolog R1A-10 n=1 Tax=Salvia miltiorrhiza TaxID=226208 RepID=UPI0025AD9C27|nr:putative late blight resistance protein homolog R1A-10 [Salvia miltiorrhiza]
MLHMTCSAISATKIFNSQLWNHNTRLVNCLLTSLNKRLVVFFHLSNIISYFLLTHTSYKYIHSALKELVMAAYGALVSLMHIIDRIENHPSPPISIDKHQVQSLTQNVTFLQDFLDGYMPPVVDDHEADPLERGIADAVYAAEDVIESQIVVQIDNRSTIVGKMISFINLFRALCKCATIEEDFNHDLQQVMEEILNVIKKEAMEIAADPLEMRIADAAYAAEDVIESHIVDVIKLGAYGSSEQATSILRKLLEKGCYSLFSDSSEADDLLESLIAVDPQLQIKGVSCINFYQDLQQVIEEMNVIKKEAMGIAAEPKLQRKVSLTSSSAVKESMMVGFDDVSLELLDRLTRGHRNRQIIPITGMGGIGKTTLARHIFEHPLVKHHFDICGWTTISQTYNVRETLRGLLCQVRGDSGGDLSEEDLGVELRKYLLCRRYLIILDDMWSVELWENMMVFFPDNNDGSRIIVTTRLSNLAAELTHSNSICMRLLDDVSSWNLFSKTVFGDEGFPPQLEEIGKKIVEKCNGLPLPIVVIGGLLAKSELTLEYWEHIQKNLSSIVNSENDEYCLRVLKLSYDHLPVYLKPCFLYMGTFEEDKEIKVSNLINLWVSEGFLKPIVGKSLETIAEEYLKELIDRNLILVLELGFIGNIKYCYMHDLLRELSLKEAQKQRFYYVLSQQCPQGINSQRRIVIPEIILDGKVLESMSLARSYICHDYTVPQLLDCRLLRTLTTYMFFDEHLIGNLFQLVNLRYLRVHFSAGMQIPSSINLLWNLHTLIVISSWCLTAPVEIWKMCKLKYVKFPLLGIYLPDPPSDDIIIMENLETLKGVIDFNLNEGVIQRIPNIKKLYIKYKDKLIDRVKSLSYLQCLSKLETLHCIFLGGSDDYLESISFPQSLKKMYLECGKFHLEEILEKMASLPLLQKLKLCDGQFGRRSWEIVEGQFPRLKYLRLIECADMECWTLEGFCLPRLEQLHLSYMESLEEFPSEIGEIATLRSIELEECSESMAMSLKRIVDEQEDLQGDPSFHVRVESSEVSQELQSLATPNFRIVKTGP